MVTGTFVPVSTIRPRAVRDVAVRAKTGKSYPRASSVSRAGPSMMTPEIPRSCAANARLPPQQAASTPLRCSSTITSPACAASIAVVPRCRDAGGRPSSRASLTVITRPEIRRSVARRWRPVTTPESPSLSSASDTAHESRRLNRVVSSSISTPALLPVRKAHRVACAGFGSIAGHVVQLVVLEARCIHRRDHGNPVLDLRRPDLEEALGELRQRVLVAALHRGNDLPIEVLVDDEV